MPAFCSAAKVPPVDSNVTFRAASARANSTKPDLSETDSRARRMGIELARYPLPLLPSIEGCGSPQNAVYEDDYGPVERSCVEEPDPLRDARRDDAPCCTRRVSSFACVGRRREL